MKRERGNLARVKSAKWLYGGAILACGAAAQAAIVFNFSGIKLPNFSSATILATTMATKIQAQLLALSKVSLSVAIPVLTTAPGGSTPTVPVVKPIPSDPAKQPTRYGINLTTLAYYNPEFPHSNLFLYDGWRRIEQGKPWDYLDQSYLTPDGWLKSVPAGVRTGHYIKTPIADGTATVRCTWQGNMPMRLQFGNNVRYGKNEVTYEVTVKQGEWASAFLHFDAHEFNAADPVRNVDCRKVGTPATQRFEPEFMNRTAQYQVARFMDWQNTNGNKRVSWANRTTPTSPSFMSADGVPVEDIVSISNQAKVDPWVTQPWNTDDEYIEKFAQYVHDNLGSGRTVYVEVSNEVWNFAFEVTHQAQREGVARGLSSNPFEACMRRYAQRSTEVFKIWTRVFADNPSRLVRVVNTQSANVWTANTVLSFADTAKYVDAIAIAPYFGHAVGSSTSKDLGVLFSQINTAVDESLQEISNNKMVANKYGKRLIAYEAGQHVILKDVALAKAVQRDNRMYDAYMRYAAGWKARAGDTLTWFASVGGIGEYGAWGMQEYYGQPMSETPKYRAVMNSRPQTN